NGYPTVFFSRFDRRNSLRSPLAITTLRLCTCCRVGPYLKVRAPDALHAIAPPIVDSSSLVGSGANSNPVAAAAHLMSPTSAPAPARTVFAFVSTGNTVVSERNDRSMPLSVIEAAVVLVWAPAQVTDVLLIVARRITSMTSSTDSGRATKSGTR